MSLMDISAYAALKGAERPSPLQYIKAQKAEAQKQGLEAYKAITEGQYKQALAGKVGQETADLQDQAQMRKQLEEAFRDYVGSGDPKKLEQMKQLDMAMKMAWTGASVVAQPVAQAATRPETEPKDYYGVMQGIMSLPKEEQLPAIRKWLEYEEFQARKMGGGATPGTISPLTGPQMKQFQAEASTWDWVDDLSGTRSRKTGVMSGDVMTAVEAMTSSYETFTNMSRQSKTTPWSSQDIKDSIRIIGQLSTKKNRWSGDSFDIEVYNYNMALLEDMKRARPEMSLKDIISKVINRTEEPMFLRAQ